MGKRSRPSKGGTNEVVEKGVEIQRQDGDGVSSDEERKKPKTGEDRRCPHQERLFLADGGDF